MRLGRRRSKHAAVLGCGPAGLFATHALVENGWDVTIFSKKRESHLYGAQYLHAPIPGLTPEGVEPVWVKYALTGTVEGYREKVYGALPAYTSIEALEPEHLAWDLRATYAAAWRRYQGLVIERELSPKVLGAPLRWDPDVLPQEPRRLDFRQFDVMLSSVPLPQLCYRKHAFQSVEIWAIGDAPDRGQLAPYRPEPNTVECDGTRDRGWYRASHIYNYVTVEWPGDSRPPLPGAAQVTKPVQTDCVCYRSRELGLTFIPIGRYGSWSKGVLTHNAYTQAAQL